MHSRRTFFNSLIFFLSLFFALQAAEFKPKPRDKRALKHQYQHYCRVSSDINEHLPVLHDLAKQCSSVIEIGLRSMNSTWGILQGLSESTATSHSYLGIDLVSPPKKNLALGETLARANGIEFAFWQANDMEVEIPVADMLFIDSLHTYCHLTYELEMFSPKIQKFIAMHDTSEPWGNLEDGEYKGDYTEYPSEFDRTKQGLWPAVEDFLARHPEWTLQERRLNCHGFTVLKRNAGKNS
jgi:hypothetical protein